MERGIAGRDLRPMIRLTPGKNLTRESAVAATGGTWKRNSRKKGVRGVQEYLHRHALNQSHVCASRFILQSRVALHAEVSLNSLNSPGFLSHAPFFRSHW